MHESFWQRLKIFFINNFWIVKINYNCIFGALAIFFLVVAFFSGIILHFHYSPGSFFVNHSSKWTTEHDTLLIMIMGFIHINSIHFIFIFLYIHSAVNLYNRTYKIKEASWYWNILSLYILTSAALNGNVVPATQLNAWSDFSIVNLSSRFPFKDAKYMSFVESGDHDKINLHQFYNYHFFFALLAVIAVYNCIRFARKTSLVTKHWNSVDNHWESAQTTNFFSIKDFFIFLFVVFAFVIVLLFFPTFFSKTDQTIVINPLLNTNYTTSEWYLATYHALRDYAGTSGLFYYFYRVSVALFFFLPFFDQAPAFLSASHKSVYNVLNCIFLFFLLALGYIGFMPPTLFSMNLAKGCLLAVITYFFFLLKISYWGNKKNP